ncbi:MAG: EthD domain-containing protein [Mycobacterium sp.]
MEKVIVVLRAETADDTWCERLRTTVADELLALGVPGLTVNVKDAPVRDSLMVLTTLEPPAVAAVSVWTQQYYGSQMTAVLDRLRTECTELAGYLVTEAVPMPGPAIVPGERTVGMANLALLRRPEGLSKRDWLRRWHLDHTQVAIDTQSTFGYTQNAVVGALTPNAPRVDAIVEELFPIEAVGSLQAFFGAADDADLADRMSKMVASTSAFGANENVDTVPTSRYVLRNPFGDNR